VLIWTKERPGAEESAVEGAEMCREAMRNGERVSERLSGLQVEQVPFRGVKISEVGLSLAAPICIELYLKRRTMAAGNPLMKRSEQWTSIRSFRCEIHDLCATNHHKCYLPELLLISHSH